MWLLNTAGSPGLTSFLDRDLEPDGQAFRPKYDYAILSHRWENNHEETDFEGMLSGSFSRLEKGWHKNDGSRREARKNQIASIWIDTCCIDKQSSAELRESINSMYPWYERSLVCYVYLRDVHVHDFDRSFVDSERSERGWTLQGLIAPATVNFYDADWQFLGDKQTLSRAFFAATGISSEVIEGKVSSKECSVAQRMSWAANKTTTRVKDRAYSLLGMFDVNMPMLYGEGKKAFFRLQEEIIKSSDDDSIFAWAGTRPRQPGLLASGPEAFSTSGDVNVVRLRSAQPPYSITNRGLAIALPVIPWTVDSYLATINCTRSNRDGPLMGIFIRHLYEDDQYARVAINCEHLLDDTEPRWIDTTAKAKIKTFHVRQAALLPGDEHYLADRICGFRLNESLLRTDSKERRPFHRYSTVGPGLADSHYTLWLQVAGECVYRRYLQAKTAHQNDQTGL